MTVLYLVRLLDQPLLVRLHITHVKLHPAYLLCDKFLQSLRLRNQRPQSLRSTDRGGFGLVFVTLISFSARVCHSPEHLCLDSEAIRGVWREL